MESAPFAPSAEQQRVIAHRGGHLQVIACAGAGKTEAIARRIAALLSEGEEPRRIVAFTFTERAAASLKERIGKRVAETLGASYLGQLGPLFVGTIHAYCWRLLQDHCIEYGNFEVIDDHRLAALLSREHRSLGLARLAPKHWQAIREFLRHAGVVENELIDLSSLAGSPFGECYSEYRRMLRRFHVLTFGTLVVDAVRCLRQTEIYAKIQPVLRYLIVDEYQDINPAQDHLIKLLAQPPVSLCVVADDDQSIYQWRGADVANMLDFSRRFTGATALHLSVNRRSRPEIIDKANSFARSIAPRLPKSMESSRPGGALELHSWAATTPEAEAKVIANTLASLHQRGYRYSDMAVLFRSVRGSSGPLLHELRSREVPLRCAGLSGLFHAPEAIALAKIYAWLANSAWRIDQVSKGQLLELHQLVRTVSLAFGSRTPIAGLDVYLDAWHSLALTGDGTVRVLPDYYRLLNLLTLPGDDLNEVVTVTRLGTLARFGSVLADFEQTMRRGSYVEDAEPRCYLGGSGRGASVYVRLYHYLQHYAQDEYESFTGEENPNRDAVDVLTVHQSKGLEWPVVFLPSLVHGRFPSKFAGKKAKWLLPEAVLPDATRGRYEGSDAEERRLFYVALTRARDALYLSRYLEGKKVVAPSTFFREIAGPDPALAVSLPLPEPMGRSRPPPAERPTLSFSDLALYARCPLRFRFASSLGFPTLVSDGLGFGRAMHQILRSLAEHSKSSGTPPNATVVDAAITDGFYLPFAKRSSFAKLFAKAKAQIERYVAEYGADFQRIWATERSFEMQLEHGVIKGRADLILLTGDGSLSLVDFKTSATRRASVQAAFQLMIYTAAARGEGLNISGAFIHGLKDGNRRPVPVDDPALGRARSQAQALMRGIVERDFPPRPEAAKCKACDHRPLCKYAL